jgi:DNA-directed RNA polymerase specialized sigma24 family protein
MDYNLILRNPNTALLEKEAAFVYFIKKYQKEAKKFAYQKIKKYVSFSSEHDEAAKEIVQDACMLLLQKVRNGALCHADYTCEAWLNQLATGLIQNLRRRELGLPQIYDADTDENAETPSPQGRFVPIDTLLIKVFGTDNKIEQGHLRDDLRQKLDALIQEVSATCKDYFAVFLAEDEELFAWWKRTRAKEQDVEDAAVLKKLRSSFDATTSNCRKTMRELIVKYNIKFF